MGHAQNGPKKHKNRRPSRPLFKTPNNPAQRGTPAQGKIGRSVLKGFIPRPPELAHERGSPTQGSDPGVLRAKKNFPWPRSQVGGQACMFGGGQPTPSRAVAACWPARVYPGALKTTGKGEEGLFNRLGYPHCAAVACFGRWGLGRRKRKRGPGVGRGPTLEGGGWLENGVQYPAGFSYRVM